MILNSARVPPHFFNTVEIVSIIKLKREMGSQDHGMLQLYSDSCPQCHHVLARGKNCKETSYISSEAFE